MSDHAVKELVIVRHVSDDHGDGHHGGAWKIAFADFMTAMMAFFLVMWLINASNEATKKAVASYFNPIKLADVTSNPRGVQELRYAASSLDKTPASDAKPKEIPIDVKLDPGAPSVELAAKPSDHLAGTAASISGAGLFVAAPAVPTADDEGLTVTAVGAPDGRSAKRLDTTGRAPRLSANDEAAATPGAKLPAAPAKTEQELAASPTSNKPAEAAQQQAAQIGEALSKALKSSVGELGPVLNVKAVPEGVLISLTDRLDFSMFQVGSAIPNTAMSDALKAVGQVLALRPGVIVVRGHTDARKYHSDSYDNWRLSTDRAHVAFEFLVKGGVDEARFEQIEGFADRALLKPDDPLAAENRRIEILMRNKSP